MEFSERYRAVYDVILKGSLGSKKDPSQNPPPMQMPAWGERLHADDTPGSEPDIDSIIAYLLSLQPPTP